MCFVKAPKPPSPPQVSKLQQDALAANQQRRAASEGTILTSTNVTKGLAGAPPTYNPKASTMGGM